MACSAGSSEAIPLPFYGLGIMADWTFVSEERMQDVMYEFQPFNEMRNELEQSRTKENDLHVAKFFGLARVISTLIVVHPNNNLFRSICWIRHRTEAGYSVGSMY